MTFCPRCFKNDCQGHPPVEIRWVGLLLILLIACTHKPDLGRERMIRACMDQLFQREDCERMIAR